MMGRWRQRGWTVPSPSCSHFSVLAPFLCTAHRGLTTGGLIITVRLITLTQTACACVACDSASVCVCVHLITAHYGGKSDNNPQTAAGGSLHIHWTAVIVLIAIWTNY